MVLGPGLWHPFMYIYVAPFETRCQGRSGLRPEVFNCCMVRLKVCSGNVLRVPGEPKRLGKAGHPQAHVPSLGAGAARSRRWGAGARRCASYVAHGSWSSRVSGSCARRRTQSWGYWAGKTPRRWVGDGTFGGVGKGFLVHAGPGLGGWIAG